MNEDQYPSMKKWWTCSISALFVRVFYFDRIEENSFKESIANLFLSSKFKSDKAMLTNSWYIFNWISQYLFFKRIICWHQDFKKTYILLLNRCNRLTMPKTCLCNVEFCLAFCSDKMYIKLSRVILGRKLFLRKSLWIFLLYS